MTKEFPGFNFKNVCVHAFNDAPICRNREPRHYAKVFVPHDGWDSFEILTKQELLDFIILLNTAAEKWDN